MGEGGLWDLNSHCSLICYSSVYKEQVGRRGQAPDHYFGPTVFVANNNNNYETSSLYVISIPK